MAAPALESFLTRGTRQTPETRGKTMALPVQVRPWLEGRDGHAAEALAATRRWAEVHTETRELQVEEDALLHERLQPGYAKRRRRAAGEAVAAGRDPAAEPDNEARLQQIAKTKRDLLAGLDVVQEQYESSYKEARNEMGIECAPEYIERLSAMVDCVLELLAAAEAERRFREPRVLQDIPIRAVPLHSARPDGQLGLWLKRAGNTYPQLDIEKRAKKAGVEL